MTEGRKSRNNNVGIGQGIEARDSSWKKNIRLIQLTKVLIKKLTDGSRNCRVTREYIHFLEETVLEIIEENGKLSE